MSAVTIYCAPCRTNHGLTAVQAEAVIQSLVAVLADEQTDPTGLETGRAGWEVCAEWCALEHLRWVRDPEAYSEHIEGMRESRLLAAAVPGENGQS